MLRLFFSCLLQLLVMISRSTFYRGFVSVSPLGDGGRTSRSRWYRQDRDHQGPGESARHHGLRLQLLRADGLQGRDRYFLRSHFPESRGLANLKPEAQTPIAISHGQTYMVLNDATAYVCPPRLNIILGDLESWRLI